MVYKLARGARLPKSVIVQRAGERLATLAHRNDGDLTPAQIVEDARPPESLLHPCFEWDDTKAADSYRLSQAGYLVRAIVTPYGEDEEEDVVRAFVSIQSEQGESSYHPIIEAMLDDEESREVIAEAQKQLDSWRKKYGHLKKFKSVVAAMGLTTA